MRAETALRELLQVWEYDGMRLEVRWAVMQGNKAFSSLEIQIMSRFRARRLFITG